MLRKNLKHSWLLHNDGHICRYIKVALLHTRSAEKLLHLCILAVSFSLLVLGTLEARLANYGTTLCYFANIRNFLMGPLKANLPPACQPQSLKSAIQHSNAKASPSSSPALIFFQQPYSLCSIVGAFLCVFLDF